MAPAVTSPGSATASAAVVTVAAAATTAGSPTVAPPAALDVSELASAGIGVYTAAGQTTSITTIASEASPLRLLATQARAMLLEASDRQGLPGAKIDATVGTDPGMPPPSYLLAGWVTASASPAAVDASSLMGRQTWTDAPSIVFPSLVLAMYASDAAEFADTLVASNGSSNTLPVPASTSRTGIHFGGHPSSPAPGHVVGICSLVQGFINGTISALFAAIGHLAQPAPPAAPHSAFGWFVAGLTAGYGLAVGVVNGLIDAAHFLVQKLIGLVTQPVLGYIARIAGVLGVVSIVVSFLRPWTIRMDAAPPSTRKAIGNEPGLAGALTATVDLGGFDEWPTDIADCAANAGVTLPPLKPVGAPIVWTMAQSDTLAVQSPGLATVLDASGSAPFRYATTQESVETAKGDPVNGSLRFQASIRRPAVADAQQTIANLVFDQIPDLIKPILQPLLAPAVKSVLDKIAGLLDNNGYAQVVVDFHTPTSTTTSQAPVTTAPSTTAPAAIAPDPCSLVTEQEAAAALGFDPGPGRENPFGDPADCGFALSRNSPGIALVDVRTGPPLGGQAGFERLRAQVAAKGDPVQTVSGIGDGAFARQSTTGGPSNGPIATFVFYKGATTVTLSVALDGAGTAVPASQVQALAVAAAGRL